MKDIKWLLTNTLNPLARLMVLARENGLIEKHKDYIRDMRSDADKALAVILIENQINPINGDIWNGIAVSIIRRVLVEYINKEFDKLRPPELPSGLIFYLDWLKSQK